MTSAAARAFVCGHPIAHSRSPVIHRYWLDELGISGSYEAIDVAPGDFAMFLKGAAQAGWAGGNVTIPHKEAAFQLVSARDRAAAAVGAVNTLWVEKGAIVGGNTDAHGFAANLDDRAPGWRNAGAALVLGAGGAARAVIHALLEAGVPRVKVANRSRERANETAGQFDARATAHDWRDLPALVPAAELLVNTTSLGMAGQPPLVVDISPLPQGAIVADIVYTPLETPLLRAARLQGFDAVDGLGMLLHQAAPGFERWFGKRPIVSEALRRYIVTDLEVIR